MNRKTPIGLILFLISMFLGLVLFVASTNYWPHKVEKELTAFQKQKFNNLDSVFDRRNAISENINNKFCLNKKGEPILTPACETYTHEVEKITEKKAAYLLKKEFTKEKSDNNLIDQLIIITDEKYLDAETKKRANAFTKKMDDRKEMKIVRDFTNDFKKLKGTHSLSKIEAFKEKLDNQYPLSNDDLEKEMQRLRYKVDALYMKALEKGLN